MPQQPTPDVQLLIQEYGLGVLKCYSSKFGSAYDRDASVRSKQFHPRSTALTAWSLGHG